MGNRDGVIASTVVFVLADVKPPKCPTCRSTLVIQTDELLTPDVEDVPKESAPIAELSVENIADEGNLQHSASHSSIGEFSLLKQGK